MRTVIIGGGYAGISAKITDPKAVIIDKSHYFLHTNRLIDVVEGKPPSVAETPRVVDVEGEVLGVDFKSRIVKITGGEVKYDKLIISAGYTQDLSRVPGASQYSFPFQETSDAIKLRESVKEESEVVIVGGGSLGVELAGVLRGKVTVLEGAKRLLSFLPEEVSSYAERALRNKGVQVVTGASVQEVKERTVITSKGEFRGDVIIFAGGFTGPELAKRLGLPLKAGRIVVNDTLQVEGYDGVYAAGDCAVHNKNFWPMSAQVATQAGEVAARNAMGGDEVFAPQQRALILRVDKDYFGVLQGRFIHGTTAKLLKEVALSLAYSRVERANLTPRQD